MEITKIFAENLRKEREAAGFSADALGQLCGVTGKHIYDVEKERKKPSVELIQAASDNLGISVSDLLRGNEATAKVILVTPMVKRIAAVPDDIYDLAINVPHDSDAWEYVRGVLIGAQKKAQSSG